MRSCPTKRSIPSKPTPEHPQLTMNDAPRIGHYESIQTNSLASAPMSGMEILYTFALTHVPGMTAMGIIITMPPSGMSPPHHTGPATVAGTILQGTAINKMNGGPTRLMPAGGAWYQPPRCHLQTSANASDTEEMKMLATVIVPTQEWESKGLAGINIIDEEWKDGILKRMEEAGVSADVLKKMIS